MGPKRTNQTSIPSDFPGVLDSWKDETGLFVVTVILIDDISKPDLIVVLKPYIQIGDPQWRHLDQGGESFPNRVVSLLNTELYKLTVAYCKKKLQ